MLLQQTHIFGSPLASAARRVRAIVPLAWLKGRF
jgi:hypothetical protein